VKRDENPWQTVEGIEFRSITVEPLRTRPARRAPNWTVLHRREVLLTRTSDTQVATAPRAFSFAQKLSTHGLELRRNRLRTLQISVGRKCNQACRHCHVDAGPWRSEMVNSEVAHRIGDWITLHRPEIVDITGGAPELSEFFRYFVETSRRAGAHVIDRCNLTIIEEPGYGELPQYLAEHEVEVIASLPCYTADNVANNAARRVREKHHGLAKTQRSWLRHPAAAESRL